MAHTHTTPHIQWVGTLPQHSGGASALAWSPDGKMLATADERGVHLWDTVQGTLYTDLATAQAHPITAMAWSPDGGTLVGASGTHVWLWNQSEQHVIAMQGDWATSICWSPDGHLLATGSNQVDAHTIMLWEKSSRRLVGRFQGTDGQIASLAWSPDGQMIGAATDDGLIRVWSIQELQPLMRLHGHTDSAWCVVWAPAGRLLASGSLDGTIRIWDIAARMQWRVLAGHAAWVYALAWSTNASYLISGSGDPQRGDRSIRLWDPLTGREIAVVEEAHEDIVHALAWDPLRPRFASASADGRVSLWGVQN